MEKLDLPRSSHNIHTLEAESSQAVFSCMCGETQSTWNFCLVIPIFQYHLDPGNIGIFSKAKFKPLAGKLLRFYRPASACSFAANFQLLWTSRGINGWKEWRSEMSETNENFGLFGREPGIESCWNLQIWTKIEWTDMKSTKYFWMNWQVLPHKLTSPRKMLPNREIGKHQMFVKSKGSVPKMPEQFRYGNLRTICPDVARPVNDVFSNIGSCFEVWSIHRGVLLGLFFAPT